MRKVYTQILTVAYHKGGNQVSGVKGYLLNTVLSIDNQTNVGGPKELWCVGTTFVQSS